MRQLDWGYAARRLRTPGDFEVKKRAFRTENACGRTAFIERSHLACYNFLHLCSHAPPRGVILSGRMSSTPSPVWQLSIFSL